VQMFRSRHFELRPRSAGVNETDITLCFGMMHDSGVATKQPCVWGVCQCSLHALAACLKSASALLAPCLRHCLLRRPRAAPRRRSKVCSAPQQGRATEARACTCRRTGEACCTRHTSPTLCCVPCGAPGSNGEPGLLEVTHWPHSVLCSLWSARLPRRACPWACGKRPSRSLRCATRWRRTSSCAR